MEIEMSPNSRANLLAAIAIVGLLGALLLVGLGSSREVDYYGPSALAATQDGELYFDAAGLIYQADVEGTLLHSISYSELGITGPVVQLSTVDDDLLLLDSGQNQVLRCDTRLWRCSPLLDHSAQPVEEILSFALAPEQGRLYLSGLDSHKIKAYDLDGSELYTLKVPKGLKYPNDMQWLGSNRLLIADTNHHRVIELEDLGEGEVRLQQQIEATNELGHKGRHWPTAIKRDDQGGTWVVNSNGMLSDGDLIYYDAVGVAQRMIDLEVESELSALAIYPAGVMVSEWESQKLILVNGNDYSISRFGGGQLQDAMSRITEQRLYWKRVYYIGVGVCMVFVSLALFAGYLDWLARKEIQLERETSRSFPVNGEWDIPDEIKAKLSPDGEGVYWLPLKAENLRILRLIAFVIPLILIWLFYTISFPASDVVALPLYLAGGMMIVVYTAMLWFMFVAVPRIRLGTDGKYFYLIDYLGRKASELPEACIKTEARLLIGAVAVPIRRRAPIFYDEKLFDTLIDPMLQQVPKTNEFVLLWQSLRNGDPATWLGVTALVMMLMIQIWL